MAPVDKLSVALTITLSVVVLHEAVTLKTAMSAALIIAGTVVIITNIICGLATGTT